MSAPGGSPGTPLIQGPSRLTRCAPARPVAMVRSCRAPEPAVVALTIAAGRGRAHTAGCARCLPPAVGPTAPVVKRGSMQGCPLSMQGCPLNMQSHPLTKYARPLPPFKPPSHSQTLEIDALRARASCGHGKVVQSTRSGGGVFQH